MNGLVIKFRSNFSNTNMRFFCYKDFYPINKSSLFRDLCHFLIKNDSYRRNRIAFCDVHHLLASEGEVIFNRCERRVTKYLLLRRNAEKT